jgi:NAD-dependent DNA ligase
MTKLNYSILEFMLSKRTARKLLSVNIRSFEDLAQSSEQELLSIPNFGHKALNEVKVALARQEINLSMSIREVKLIFAKQEKECDERLRANCLFMEKLIAEHKECKLRCQEIEKQIDKLLGRHCVEGL